MMTPPLLRARLLAIRSRRSAPPARPMPVGGWLVVTDDGAVALRAVPPDDVALHVALQAAQLVTDARPDGSLLDWLGGLGDTALPWDAVATRQLLELLRTGSPRSWRLLDKSGVLERALPELAAIVHHRREDPFELDAVHSLGWTVVERLHELTGPDGDAVAVVEHRKLAHTDRLLLAAVLVDPAGDGPDDPVAAARRLVLRLGLDASTQEEVALLVAERTLLWAALRRPDGLAEEHVLRIATHLGTPERARALYLLALAMGGGEPGERELLDELHARLQTALARPEVSGLPARDLVEDRRQAALRLLGEGPAATVLATAPRAWVVANEPAALARQADLVARRQQSGDLVACACTRGDDGLLRLDVSAADAAGLLARAAAALAGAGLDVAEAGASVWGPDAAVQTFTVRGAQLPDPDVLRLRLAQAVAAPPPPISATSATISWDDEGSPWTTVCTTDAPDRPGLLAALSAAFATAGAHVHSARATTADGMAHDVFEVTNGRGEKLADADKARVVATLAGGTPQRSRFRSPRAWLGPQGSKPSTIDES